MERKKNWKKIIVLLVFLILAGGIFSFWGLAMREFLLKEILPLLRVYTYFGGAWKNAESEVAQLNYLLDLRLEEYEKEIQSLRLMLEMKERAKTAVRAADVLWYGTELGREFLIVNRGEDAGVEAGDIAVDARGFLIGTVREVGSDYAKISVSSNLGETYEIDFLPVSAKALARGIGARTLGIELIPADFSIRKGDIILLRETGGRLFFLGEIVREEASGGAALKQARAVLLADPSRVTQVLIFEMRKPPAAR